MARVHHVKKRTIGKRGERELNCSTCRQPIEYGDPYKWFKRKSAYGGTVFAYHPDCQIRPSHRTTSRMGEIYDAQEDFDISGAESVDDIRSDVESFAQIVRDVAEGYRESQENMESGFGHATSQSDELGEKADELENWADELESVDLDDEEPTEDDIEDDETDTAEERKDALAEAVENWLEEQRDKARDAIGNCPV